MAGWDLVTVYFFTWYESERGQWVQAPRPATLAAITAACGCPLLDTAHEIAITELNELGFLKRPSRNCVTCGTPLVYLGAFLDTYGGRRRDQAFGCPQGHEQWRYFAPRRTWQRHDRRGEASEELSA